MVSQGRADFNLGRRITEAIKYGELVLLAKEDQTLRARNDWNIISKSY